MLELCEGCTSPQLVPTDHEAPASAVRFDGLSCFFATNSGLDVSRYTAGILCGDLLARRRVVYDYANNRVGVGP